MTPFEKRPMADVVRTVMERLGGRGPIHLIRDAIKNTATHAEWEGWAESAITDKIRKALRAEDHFSVDGEYTAQHLFTLDDYVILAKAQAQRGRQFFDEVRRLAAQCEDQLGETFDAEEIISDALGGAA